MNAEALKRSIEAIDAALGFTIYTKGRHSFQCSGKWSIESVDQSHSLLWLVDSDGAIVVAIDLDSIEAIA